MELHDVRYEADDAVALITLDRPRYRNAQSWRLLDELDLALDHAMADAKIAVSIVRGTGEHFSAGHDLGTPEQIEDVLRRGIPPIGLEEYDSFRKYNVELNLKWRNLPKPTVAIFAAPDARFLAGQVEYFSIPWDIGVRKAKELLFENRFISAEEAHAHGFVNRIIPAEHLEAETLAWARRVAESPAGALRMAKLAINHTQDIQGFTNALEAAFHNYVVMSQLAGYPRPYPTNRRLPGVDLALRGARGERAGQSKG